MLKYVKIIKHFFLSVGCMGLIMIAGFLWIFNEISEANLAAFILMSTMGFFMSGATYALEKEIIKKQVPKKIKKEKSQEDWITAFLLDLLKIFHILFLIIGTIGIFTILYLFFAMSSQIKEWIISGRFWMLFIISLTMIALSIASQKSRQNMIKEKNNKKKLNSDK